MQEKIEELLIELADLKLSQANEYSGNIQSEAIKIMYYIQDKCEVFDIDFWVRIYPNIREDFHRHYENYMDSIK